VWCWIRSQHTPIFWFLSHQSSSSHDADYEERMKEMITTRVREELIRQFEHYGIRSPVDRLPELDPFVPPTGKFFFYKL